MAAVTAAAISRTPKNIGRRRLNRMQKSHPADTQEPETRIDLKSYHSGSACDVNLYGANACTSGTVMITFSLVPDIRKGTEA